MNTSNHSIIRTLLIVVLMLLAAFSRLMPHPANFTAIMAIALFGGAKFKNPSLAIVVPLIVMLITDVFIGFYSLMPIIYGCIVVTALIGTYISRRSSPMMILIGSVLASTLFFLATNAGVWYHNPQFAPTFSGLVLCYDFALPFFKNQLLGDLFFNLVLFGSFYLAKTRIPSLAY